MPAAALRVQAVLAGRYRWVHSLAKRYLARFPGPLPPRHWQVRRFVETDTGFLRARRKYLLRAGHPLLEPPWMRPSLAAAPWDLPALTTPGDLSDWLGIDPADLLWFADLRNGNRHGGENLQHYRYAVHQKPSGGLRLIESPKTRLKEIQRQILHELLDNFPPHAAAHGFVSQRSIVTFAAPHCGQRVILRLDLQDFFPSLLRPRINAIFRTAGYPDAVAQLLAGLCTNATPNDIWPRHEAAVAARRLYRQPHLPQGAPTSPALANIAAHRLDTRLTALAQQADARYTRYADDLAFSGGKPFQNNTRDFAALAAAIAVEEGFAVNHRKTRVMPQGVRQHLAGVTANQHPNLSRRDFDQLKATLTSCLRHGPHAQNRQDHPDFRAHLQGRIAFAAMVNPTKTHRLQAIFDQIDWT